MGKSLFASLALDTSFTSRLCASDFVENCPSWTAQGKHGIFFSTQKNGLKTLKETAMILGCSWLGYTKWCKNMLFLRVLQCFFICGRGRTYNECFLRVLRHIYSPLQIQCFCCSLLRVVVAAWRIFDLHTVFPLESRLQTIATFATMRRSGVWFFETEKKDYSTPGKVTWNLNMTP